MSESSELQSLGFVYFEDSRVGSGRYYLNTFEHHKGAVVTFDYNENHSEWMYDTTDQVLYPKGFPNLVVTPSTNINKLKPFENTPLVLWPRSSASFKRWEVDNDTGGLYFRNIDYRLYTLAIKTISESVAHPPAIAKYDNGTHTYLKFTGNLILPPLVINPAPSNNLIVPLGYLAARAGKKLFYLAFSSDNLIVRFSQYKGSFWHYNPSTGSIYPRDHDTFCLNRSLEKNSQPLAKYAFVGSCGRTRENVFTVVPFVSKEANPENNGLSNWVTIQLRGDSSQKMAWVYKVEGGRFTENSVVIDSEPKRIVLMRTTTPPTPPQPPATSFTLLEIILVLSAILGVLVALSVVKTII